MHLVRNLWLMARGRAGRDLRSDGRLFAPSFWNGVVAKPRREGMAAEQPLQSQPNSPCDAETLNRLVGIMRTAGVKPAVPRKQKRQIRFVKATRQERCTHGQALWNRPQPVLFRWKACHFFGFHFPARAPLCSSRSKSMASAANGA